MSIHFSKTLFAALLCLMLVSPAQATEVELTPLTNFKADAALAKAKKLPILLMFSASYCGFCAIVKEEFLKPMKLSGDYTDKVIVRVLEIDAIDDVIDINGQPIDPESLAQRYHVQLTPTLIFVDSRGEELVQQMVGVTTVDFYGGYLDDAIDNSLNELRGNHRLSQQNP